MGRMVQGIEADVALMWGSMLLFLMGEMALQRIYGPYIILVYVIGSGIWHVVHKLGSQVLLVDRAARGSFEENAEAFDSGSNTRRSCATQGSRDGLYLWKL